jgi:hypothetical protein
VPAGMTCSSPRGTRGARFDRHRPWAAHGRAEADRVITGKTETKNEWFYPSIQFGLHRSRQTDPMTRVQPA